MSEPPSPKNDADSNDEEEEESVEEVNNTLNTSFTQSTMVFPATMPLGRDIMVLRGDMINSEDAEDFYEQALRCPNLKVHECMGRQALQVFHVKLMCDQNLSVIDRRDRHDWPSRLTITQVAVLMLQYFCPHRLGDSTLAENFANVPFHYSLETHEDEISTYMAYLELVTNHERSRGALSTIEHQELVTILEKRLPKGSRIQNEYFQLRNSEGDQTPRWDTTMQHIIQVVSSARDKIDVVQSYGNPKTGYSYPATAVSPRVQRLAAAEALTKNSHLEVRKGSTEDDVPLRASSIQRRETFDDDDVPLVKSKRVCRSCGDPHHSLADCPQLYYTDCNSEHNIDWSESVLGKLWAAEGQPKWNGSLKLPGYEKRERYHPKGSQPFLMCSTDTVNKKAKNKFGQGKGSSQSSSSSSAETNQPGQGQTKAAGRGYQGKNPRQNSGRGGGSRYNPPQGHSAPDAATQGKQFKSLDVDSSCDTDFDVDTSISITVPQHIEFIREEYLHNPSTLPSNYLNVTVMVQDKDKTQASERRTVGKAVLDTANYSEDFISFDMIEKINAFDACYEAPTAITVCSGLDNQCYLNNEIILVKLKFHSYDGECHTIELPMRVNRKTKIDLLISRLTVNKYDFMSLTPFAFGISPELSAENKRKSDARRKEFEAREAIDRLDPLHVHKYTRRMISEGFEPDSDDKVIESITPHYDQFKGITASKLSSKREPYGLCPYPNKKKVVFTTPPTKESDVSCVHPIVSLAYPCTIC